MVKKEYSEIKKKFPKLPDFSKLDDEFEVSDIEKSKFLLRQVKRKIGEKLENVIKLLEQILQPDPGSFADLYECSCFDAKTKKEILALYSRIMLLYRTIMESDLLNDEKKDAEVISDAFSAWPKLRVESAGYVEKLKACWKKPEEVKDVLEYLG